ncbi:substrate-binding domain-containing protein, partial [Streptomyces lavendulae]|uniref:substrate-binding domain-containing protein n=1 Tax=Streptomyces lavendulae TaxID=1914 RepID=UPI0036B3A8B9
SSVLTAQFQYAEVYVGTELPSGSFPVTRATLVRYAGASGHRIGLVLGRVPDVTAVFVASDEMAFGVIRALHELGRRVPEDVSVVGVDDIELAAYCTPPLTTVAQPFDRMGALAVERLLRHVADPGTVSAPASVVPELVVRASTAPARNPKQN